LAGIRVLDLTRVLAGPVATRFLAAFGADVLRIDPPDWEEPGVVPEVTVGKRCAGLDLRRETDRAQLDALIAGADVLVHGYRPGALAARGYDAVRIRSLNPNLVDVALCAYGWSGPMGERRGFDSLVQRSTGIAERGQRWAGADRPTPLPVQALDHATGYLMASAAIRGLRLRAIEGIVATARVSLARTAMSLLDEAPARSEAKLAPESEADLTSEVEVTDWGRARRLRLPVSVEGRVASFDRGARALRRDEPRWPA
jgi:crotonobetainyl-CoA:carnitine CoA-transferase CaiB-like acyl-CoA transferase